MTRNLLLQSVKEVEEHNQPATITKVHVDDTAQFSSHKEAKTLFSNILAAAIHFKDKTTKLKLTLSSKKGAGSVIASSARLAKEIKETLKKSGIKYEVELTARDLGILYTAGKSNPSTFSRTRILKTKPRNSKTVALAKISRRARILFTGSVFPAATWGHEAGGLDIKDIIRLETDAANATGVNKGRCRFTTLSVCYGPTGTIKYKLLLQLLKSWIATVRQMHKLNKLHELRSAWRSAVHYYKQLPNPIPKTKARGMMSNVITLLLDISWNPITYNC